MTLQLGITVHLQLFHILVAPHLPCRCSEDEGFLTGPQQGREVLLFLVVGVVAVSEVPVADVNLIIILKNVLVLQVREVELVDVPDVGAHKKGLVVVRKVDGQGSLVLELEFFGGLGE